MAKAGSVSCITTAQAAFSPSPDGPLTTIYVWTPDAVVEVNEPTLHGSAFFLLPPNTLVPLRVGDGGLGVVTAKTTTGTGTLYYGGGAVT